MHSPNRNASDLINTELNRELQYNTVEMAAIVARNVPLMNDEQRTIYDRIMFVVSAGQGGFFFLDANRWNWQNISYFVNSRRNTFK